MEKEMNRLYREIAETVNEMIPEDWSKFNFMLKFQKMEVELTFFIHLKI